MKITVYSIVCCRRRPRKAELCQESTNINMLNKGVGSLTKLLCFTSVELTVSKTAISPIKPGVQVYWSFAGSIRRNCYPDAPSKHGQRRAPPAFVLCMLLKTEEQ